MEKMRAAILASGRGSNMEAVIKSVHEDSPDIDIKVVLGNRKDAPALEKAEISGVRSEFVDPHLLSREEYDNKLVAKLKEYNVNFIILAGFMSVLGRDFIRAFPMKIVNIHPSLLPAFPGINAQKQALEYGVKYSGCTVHYVVEEVDAGPIIAQKVVPVEEDDTVGSLSARILAEEHKVYPWAIKKISQGKVIVEGRRVYVLGGGC